MAVVALALVMSDCARSGSDAGSAPKVEAATSTSTSKARETSTTTGQSGLEAACERLRDLANEVLALQSDQGPDQIAAVDRAVDAFRDAAWASGDAGMASESDTIGSSFKVYLQSSGSDSQEAGQTADVAMDRAGGRCIETGAIDSMPTQPN